MKLTIGFTRTDRDNDYIPGMDGYRPGAAQDVVTLEVDAPSAPDGGWESVVAAEAYFVATNAPSEVVARDPLATAILHALLLADEVQSPQHRLTLDVGDTVQVDDGPVLSVERFGFQLVTLGE